MKKNLFFAMLLFAFSVSYAFEEPRLETFEINGQSSADNDLILNPSVTPTMTFNVKVFIDDAYLGIPVYITVRRAKKFWLAPLNDITDVYTKTMVANTSDYYSFSFSKNTYDMRSGDYYIEVSYMGAKNVEQDSIGIAVFDHFYWPMDQRPVTITLDCYMAPKVNDRMVTGDFDNDGFKDDIASFYHYAGNNSAIHIWKSNTQNLAFDGSTSWWNSTNGFDASKIVSFTCGDYDGDGFEDDVAALYAYTSLQTNLYVWYSNGNSFIDGGIKWSSSQYSGTNVSQTGVSGDFDLDGRNDDILLLYKYSTFNCEFHRLRCNADKTFSFTSMWTGLQYEAYRAKGRIVSGDFNQDGKKAEVAVFYDFGGFKTQAHIFRSFGNTLSSQGAWWEGNSYDGSKIKNRVVSGDFDGDGYFDDVTCFYDYGNSTTSAHVFKSNGSSLPYSGAFWTGNSYAAVMISNRVVSADFSNDGKTDIAAMYDYTNSNSRIHVWKSQQTTFTSPSTAGWWNCGGVTNKTDENSTISNFIETINEESSHFEIYPNPSNGLINVRSDQNFFKSIEILSSTGQIILTISGNELSNTSNSFDLSAYSEGLYFVRLIDNDNIQYLKKIVLVK